MRINLQKHIEPSRDLWQKLTKRPALNSKDLNETIEDIFSKVDESGDKAIMDYTLKYDGVSVNPLLLDSNEISNQVDFLDADLKDAIIQAYQNIYRFHLSQKEEIKRIETCPGVLCWREDRPIDRIGIYIPGGSAPLFSTVLMLGVPAKIAGCKEVVLCTPPGEEGQVHPAILFAAELCDINTVIKAGGAQAIAGMTFGTRTITKVDKIFGPGNQYVTSAKLKAQSLGCAIDLPAGPSEVLVYADDSCPVSYIASDLLAQAEHGPDSQVVLVTDGSVDMDVLQRELERQLLDLPRNNIALSALEHAFIASFAKTSTAFDFINTYAPEHLIIACQNAESYSKLVKNAGSVFIGNFSPESAGDYASGTNHTLPTSGFAKSYSGVSLDSFVKKITFQTISKEGLHLLAPSVIAMAEAEELHGHAFSIKIRVQ